MENTEAYVRTDARITIAIHRSALKNMVNMGCFEAGGNRIHPVAKLPPAEARPKIQGILQDGPRHILTGRPLVVAEAQKLASRDRIGKPVDVLETIRTDDYGLVPFWITIGESGELSRPFPTSFYDRMEAATTRAEKN